MFSSGQTQRVRGLLAEANSAVALIWQQLHVELTTQSLPGKRIVAEQSGYYIQFDQPELVIDAIREVVEAVRAS